MCKDSRSGGGADDHSMWTSQGFHRSPPPPQPPQLQAGLEPDKLSQLGSVLPESRTPWEIRSPLLYSPSEGWGMAI